VECRLFCRSVECANDELASNYTKKPSTEVAAHACSDFILIHMYTYTWTPSVITLPLLYMCMQGNYPACGVIILHAV